MNEIIQNKSPRGRRLALIEEKRASSCTCGLPCSASELTSQPERPLADRYHELLYAVARKFPGESRHETALRYIRQAEEVHAGSCMQNAGNQGLAPQGGNDGN